MAWLHHHQCNLCIQWEAHQWWCKEGHQWCNRNQCITHHRSKGITNTSLEHHRHKVCEQVLYWKSLREKVFPLAPFKLWRTILYLLLYVPVSLFPYSHPKTLGKNIVPKFQLTFHFSRHCKIAGCWSFVFLLF